MACGFDPRHRHQKIQVERLGFFYPNRRVGISSRISVYLISPCGAGYHHGVAVHTISLRFDDIQHSVLMIYRNKLRMIYNGEPLIF